MSEPDHAWRRPRLSILVKLLIAFVVPTVALFALFAFVAHEVAHSNLEDELGRRLSAVASSASTQLRGKYLVDLIAGDEEDLRYAGARRKLLEVKEATSVARIYVFDRNMESRVDTDDGVQIGTKYHQAELDRLELERVFGDAHSVSSMLFQGSDGVSYKAGYAPVYASGDDREIVLAIGVDAPATFFERLSSLRRNLFLYGALLALAVIMIAVIVAMRITRPVRHLAAAAERIGSGNLEEPVVRRSRDEIGLLAVTMEKMRKELHERDERMQLMLSGIAHEVRNPLGGIELFSGILRDELDADDERLGHVARIEKEVSYLKDVVNDFLEYAHRDPPQLVRVDMGELVKDVCEVLASDATAADVALSTDIAAPTTCRGDDGQLRRVMLNLVRNAIQASATDDDRRVAISVEATDHTIRVVVENTGTVIPQESLERIFEPFYTTREKGTGLGLAFAREIIVDHAGTINVVSKRGQGTTFTVELPATKS